jgi:hypothetical protein
VRAGEPALTLLSKRPGDYDHAVRRGRLTCRFAPVLLALALAATTAAATSPSQFRVRLNAVCSNTTNRLNAAEAAIKKASVGGNQSAYYAAYAGWFAALHAEDLAIDRSAPTASLKAVMAKPISLIRGIDPTVVAGLAAARRHDSSGIASSLNRMSAATSTLNAALDAAGLRACGSGQG